MTIIPDKIYSLTILHSEEPKLYGVLALLSAKGVTESKRVGILVLDCTIPDLCILTYFNSKMLC